jgi:phosphatidylinositol alpha-mannosyltransferase
VGPADAGPYALLLAVGVHVPAPLATAAAILVAVNVTAAVPLTPSNVGTFQAACIGVLAAAGVGSSLGLSYGLLLQAAELATALALALPAAAAEITTGERRYRRHGGDRGAAPGVPPLGQGVVVDGVTMSVLL